MKLIIQRSVKNLRSPKTAKVSNKNTTDETNNEDVEIL